MRAGAKPRDVDVCPGAYAPDPCVDDALEAPASRPPPNGKAEKLSLRIGRADAARERAVLPRELHQGCAEANVVCAQYDNCGVELLRDRRVFPVGDWHAALCVDRYSDPLA